MGYNIFNTNLRLTIIYLAANFGNGDRKIMKVLGLVVEYNPFHNGHLYHLEQSKALCSADYVICVLSGNFIQRGEPAIVNKWARTKMALHSGIDLVIELPVVYSMASAEYFAFGALKILDSLGVTDYICFGSESGNISELDLLANILHNEPEVYKNYLKENLKIGLSFPTSRENALRKYLMEFYGTEVDIESIIASSNNILGIEYLKAIKKLKSNIIPMTIKRVNNSYKEGALTGNISSATAIRNHMLRDDYKKPFLDKKSTLTTDLKNMLPYVSLSILQEEFSQGRGPISSACYGDLLLALLKRMTPSQIKSLPYVSEGLENRIKASADSSGCLDELLESINTKRYTTTRIQRILFNILTGITAKEFVTFNDYGGPQYIRVLGFNKKGTQLLSKINMYATLPVIVKTADFKNSCNPLLTRMLEIENSATDMYVMGYSNTDFKKSGQEFTQNIIKML